jgi:uncharacterized membrane protein
MVGRIYGKTAFMMALFVASIFVLGIKLLNPTPIQIYIKGSEMVVSQVPGFFTYADVIIVIISSIVLGISGTYLLLYSERTKAVGEQVLEERKKRWKEISRNLKNDELTIYKAVIDSDGIVPQSKLIEKTGLSKSNVSRALDLLESKGLIERRRRGMGNIVLLK